MKLLFRLWARGLAITLAAIFLSGCSTFSTFFQNETVSIEGQTSQKQRLGIIQLRVAETALAHRDYNAAIGLFEEAAQNKIIRHAALWQLGKLYELTGNFQTALTTYRILLRETPSHEEAGIRVTALTAQTISKSAQNQTVDSFQSLGTSISRPRADARVKLSKAALPTRTVKSRQLNTKPELKKTVQNSLVKGAILEKRFKRPQPKTTAMDKGKKRASRGSVTSHQNDDKVFRVQLAAFRYKSNAVRALAQFNAMIAPRENLFALLTRSERGNNQNGIHYRIRTKAMTTASVARNICEQVRSIGHRCLVILHNQSMWRSSA